MSPFWVHLSPWFPPCFASIWRLHDLAAPRTGRIGHSLEKVAAADGPLEGFWVPFWGFPGVDSWVLLGCMLPACPICTRHPAGCACAMARRRKGGSWAGSRPSASLSSWNSRAFRWARMTKWCQRTTSTAWWRRRRAGFPSLCPRRTWPTFGIAYGSSSWRLRTASFSPLENEWDRQDQLRWFSRDDPPPLQQPELLRWRHWRPGKIREMEPTTQRALKLHCAGNGRNGSLPLRPLCGAHCIHAGHPGEDFRKEALDLLGDSRFRTLRQHCLVYESLRKRGFTVIPWQERHVRSLLNQLADEEVTPCKLRQVWNTLKWFSKTFGLLKIDELHRLKPKKSSLEEALTDTVTRLRRWSPARRSFGLWRRGPATSAWVPPAPARRRPRARADTRCWTLSSWGSPGSRLVAALTSRTYSTFTPRTLSTPATLWN